jgi:hypothetical protein
MGFQITDLPNHHIQVTGSMIGKDENDTPIKASWKTTLIILGGRWQIMSYELLDRTPLPPNGELKQRQ